MYPNSALVEQNFNIYSLGSRIFAGSWTSKYIDGKENENGILLTVELYNVPTTIDNIKVTDDDGYLHIFQYDASSGGGTGNRLWFEDIGNNLYIIYH